MATSFGIGGMTSSRPEVDPTSRPKGTKQPQLIEAILNQLSQPAFIITCDSTLLNSNGAAEELFGVAQAAKVVRSCAEFLGCRSCDGGCNVLKTARMRSGAECSIKIVATGGRERIAFVKALAVDDCGGRLRGAIAIITRIVETPVPRPPSIIAHSVSMRAIIGFARRIAASDATTVLLQGESGTGKTMIARLLHDVSPRANSSFVSIDCGTLPAALLETELFGHEKGAFADARIQKKGLLEMARHGTLFLDQVGELPLTLQVRLLRVMEERNFRRLGGLEDIALSCRVVAADRQDLRSLVPCQVFREDLFYRLNTVEIAIPPLRERPDDILPLARYFLERLSRKYECPTPALSEAAAQRLLHYNWPGNTRELRSVLERALQLEDSKTLVLTVRILNFSANGGRSQVLPLLTRPRMARATALFSVASTQLMTVCDGEESP